MELHLGALADLNSCRYNQGHLVGGLSADCSRLPSLSCSFPPLTVTLTVIAAHASILLVFLKTAIY